jgi:hypothetical protein
MVETKKGAKMKDYTVANMFCCAGGLDPGFISVRNAF